MWFMSWVLVSGCGKATPISTDKPTEVPIETDAPTPVPTADTADTEDTAPPVDTGPITPDCSVLPSVPSSSRWSRATARPRSSDSAFDGRHVSVRSANLVARDLPGQDTLLAANVGPVAACTRAPRWSLRTLPSEPGTLLIVDPVIGERQVIATGLSYPNGAEIDPDGFIYVTEQNGGRVQRINSVTGENITIAEHLIDPNGIIFSPDYSILYVVSFGGRPVFAIHRTGPDTRSAEASRRGNGVNGASTASTSPSVATSSWPSSSRASTGPEARTGDAGGVSTPSSEWLPKRRLGLRRGVTGRGTLHVSDRDQGSLFAIEIGLNGKVPFSRPTVP